MPCTVGEPDRAGLPVAVHGVRAGHPRPVAGARRARRLRRGAAGRGHGRREARGLGGPDLAREGRGSPDAGLRRQPRPRAPAVRGVHLGRRRCRLRRRHGRRRDARADRGPVPGRRGSGDLLGADDDHRRRPAGLVHLRRRADAERDAALPEDRARACGSIPAPRTWWCSANCSPSASRRFTVSGRNPPRITSWMR